MNKYLQIFLLLAICFSSCKKKPEVALADIKKKCKEINEKQKDLKSKHVDDLTSARGGAITGFYKDDEVKKILSERYTDTCRTFTEYYFDDGMLIFILKQNFVYNLPITYTEEKAKERNDSVWYDDKKTQLGISRYYFNDNKLIKWVDAGGNDIPPKTAKFIDKGYELLGETVILIKQLKEQ